MAILRNGVNTSTKQADKSAKRDAVIKQLYKDTLAIYFTLASYKRKGSLAKLTELIIRYTDAGLPVPTILSEKLHDVISELPKNQCLYSSQAELDAQAKAGPNCHSVRVKQLSDLPKTSGEYFQSLPKLSFQQKVERMWEADLAKMENTPPAIHRASCVDLTVEQQQVLCACEVNDKWADQDWYKKHAASGDCCAYKPWI